MGDLAKGFRVDDVGEFVESPEQKLIVSEVAEFSSNPYQAITADVDFTGKGALTAVVIELPEITDFVAGYDAVAACGAAPAAEPDAAAVDAAPEAVAEPVAAAPAEPVAEAPADPVADAPVAEEPAAEPVAEDAPAPETPPETPAEEPKAAEPVPEREQTPEAAMAGASTDTPAEPDKPKKRGWWSIGKG